jgi:hypothetical protein
MLLTAGPAKAVYPVKTVGGGVSELCGIFHKFGAGVTAVPQMRSESGTPRFTVLRPTFSACQNGCFDRVPNRELAILRGWFDMLLNAGPAKAVYPVKTMGGGVDTSVRRMVGKEACVMAIQVKVESLTSEH